MIWNQKDFIWFRINSKPWKYLIVYQNMNQMLTFELIYGNCDQNLEGAE